MSRRPPAVLLPEDRMAPGGRMWSESPVRRPYPRVRQAGTPTATPVPYYGYEFNDITGFTITDSQGHLDLVVSYYDETGAHTWAGDTLTITGAVEFQGEDPALAPTGLNVTSFEVSFDAAYTPPPAATIGVGIAVLTFFDIYDIAITTGEWDPPGDPGRLRVSIAGVAGHTMDLPPGDVVVVWDFTGNQVRVNGAPVMVASAGGTTLPAGRPNFFGRTRYPTESIKYNHVRVFGVPA